MGQHDGVDGAGVERELAPVAQPQFLEALKQAAIEQHRAPVRAYQVGRPGHRAGGAEELHGGLHGSGR
jgi:hypothetical protein